MAKARMPADRWHLPKPLAAFDAVATDGTALSVRRHGNPDGPRLVLSHGNGFAVDSYYPFWSAFTTDFDCFVFDFRNHGWNAVGAKHAHNFANFVSDAECVLADIDLRYGTKPKFGIFHSLSALTALQCAAGSDAFAGLVLLDPPIYSPGVFPEHMVDVGTQLGDIAGRRRNRFDSPQAFAENLARKPVFDRLAPAVIDLFARTTLRLATDGQAYELRCPREYEAQIYNYIYCWSIALDLQAISCPIKVVGGDPTAPHSFMPSFDIVDIEAIDYDFIPESTHLMLLEEPAACARLCRDFLALQGFS